MDEAELILAVFDGSRALSEGELALIDELTHRAIAGQTVLPVLNKSDLGTGLDLSALAPLGEPVRLSANTSEGMDALSERICTMFVDGQIDLRHDAVIATAQQHAACLRALTSLRCAIDGLAAGVSLDLCCVDVEAAMCALSELDGRAEDEDIVNEILLTFASENRRYN